MRLTNKNHVITVKIVKKDRPITMCILSVVIYLGTRPDNKTQTYRNTSNGVVFDFAKSVILFCILNYISKLLLLGNNLSNSEFISFFTLSKSIIESSSLIQIIRPFFPLMYFLIFKLFPLSALKF